MTRALFALVLSFACAAPALAQDAQKAKPDLTPVTIDVERAPLVQVLRKLCAERGLNFVADPRVLDRAGDVCLVLKDASFEEAVETIGDLFDLEVRLRGRILTVRAKPPEPGPPRSIRDAAPTPKPSDANRMFEKKSSEPKSSEPAKSEPARVDGPVAKAGGGEPTKSDTAKNDAARADGPAPSEPKPVDGGASAKKADGEGPPPGSTLGTVIDVAGDHVKLKERSGDTRDFYAPEPKKDDLTLRASRIAAALRGLKKGDQVALLYRSDDKGRTVITDIIGGPKRAPEKAE